MDFLFELSMKATVSSYIASSPSSSSAESPPGAGQGRLGFPTSFHAQKKLRFGAGLVPTLAFLENNPLADTLLKDVLGFNAPKITLTRTWRERWDVATSEFSNTAITLSSSLLLAPFIRHPVKWLTGVSMKDLASDLSALSPQAMAAISPKVKLARLAAALGFLMPFSAAFWSSVFFRNWLTLKRTQTADFESIIGLRSAEDAKKRAKKRSLQEEMAHQLAMMARVLGTGMGLGAASVLGFGLAARKFGGKALPAAAEWLFDKFHLTGKGAIQTKWLSTLIFWLLPAYGGWIHAARSRNERLEQTLKAANGVMWFSLFNPLIVRPISRVLFANHPGAKAFQRSDATLAEAAKDPSWFVAMENKMMDWFKKDRRVFIPSFQQIESSTLEDALKAQVRQWKTNQFGIGLGMTIFFMGAAPQLLNWVLTRRRFEREEAHGQRPSPSTPSPSSPALNLATGPGSIRHRTLAFSAFQG